MFEMTFAKMYFLNEKQELFNYNTGKISEVPTGSFLKKPKRCDADISLHFKRHWEQSLARAPLPWKLKSLVLTDNWHNLKADSPLK